MAAIAPWFRLRLPSCGPGFESQALHLRFFQLLKLYRENNENKQKEAGIGPFFKKNTYALNSNFCKLCKSIMYEKKLCIVLFLNE